MIELMVVIAIVAILTTIAAPSFKSMLQSNNMTSTVNSFLADMRYARSEAIRRGGAVVMCRSAAPEATTPTCSDGGWQSGWIIFHDLNSDEVKDSTDPVLRVQGPIVSMDLISASGSQYILPFTATGRLPSSVVTTLTFGGPNFDAQNVRKVCINAGGRGRICT